jgi:hypothetical protein
VLIYAGTNRLRNGQRTASCLRVHTHRALSNKGTPACPCHSTAGLAPWHTAAAGHASVDWGRLAAVDLLTSRLLPVTIVLSISSDTAHTNPRLASMSLGFWQDEHASQPA